MSEAGDRCFVDTNVLLYSFDPAGAAKHMLARRWLNFLWSAGSGRISWQVLNEFYANAVRKTGVPTATARKSVEALAAWQPMGVHIALVRRAWHWMDHAGLSYWDSLILAAAESLGCRWLLSEDFQAGRRFGSVEVVNPFQAEPKQFFSGHPR